VHPRRDRCLLAIRTTTQLSKGEPAERFWGRKVADLTSSRLHGSGTARFQPTGVYCLPGFLRTRRGRTFISPVLHAREFGQAPAAAYGLPGV